MKQPSPRKQRGDTKKISGKVRKIVVRFYEEKQELDTEGDIIDIQKYIEICRLDPKTCASRIIKRAIKDAISYHEITNILKKQDG